MAPAVAPVVPPPTDSLDRPTGALPCAGSSCRELSGPTPSADLPALRAQPQVDAAVSGAPNSVYSRSSSGSTFGNFLRKVAILMDSAVLLGEPIPSSNLLATRTQPCFDAEHSGQTNPVRTPTDSDPIFWKVQIRGYFDDFDCRNARGADSLGQSSSHSGTALF